MKRQDPFGIKPGILKILEDRQWHSFSEFVPLMANVPPEQATQRYSTSSSGKNAKEQVCVERQVDKGRMIILQDRIHNLKESTKHRMEVRATIDGGMEYRLPGEADNSNAWNMLRKLITGKGVKITLVGDKAGRVIITDLEVLDA